MTHKAYKQTMVFMKNKREKLKKQTCIQIFAIMGLVWMILFCFIPMVFNVIAFMDYDILHPFWESDWVGLEHFVDFFTNRDFAMVMKNTFAIGILKLFIGFPVPILFALMLNEVSSNSFKRIAQTITYLPHFISWVIVGGMMVSMLSDSGVFNDILIWLGVLEEPIYFLAEPDCFWGIVTISEIWKETGWQAIIYLAAIAGISPELYEAATVDGASRFKRIWHVTLPGILPTVVILFILTAGKLMESNFNQIMVLRNQLNYETSTTLDIHVFQYGVQRYQQSYATAVGLFNSVVSLLLVVLSNFVSRKLTGTGIMGDER